MANSAEARRRRKEARKWVEDDSQPEGGYWYADSIPEQRHGEPGIASNWYCTCPKCRKTATSAKRSRRRERYAERVWVEPYGSREGYWFAPNAPKHGGRTSSNWGCGCPICKSDEKESRDEEN